VEVLPNRRTVKTIGIGIGIALALSLPISAHAQGTMFPDAAPAEPHAAQPNTTATAQPDATATATASTPVPTTTAPVVVVTPPSPRAVAPQGQWVYTETYGYIWVPQGTTTVIVQEQPYAYLYTPVYGWTWYGSPWGPGAFYVGPWVHHGYMPARVWHRGSWFAPHVVVRTRVVGPGVYRGAPRYHHGRR
jgi:hypothetical protein